MTPFNNVYITHRAAYMPGLPINNEEMDAYIGSINRMSSKNATWATSTRKTA
jgi:hypothetical protein